MHTSAAQQDRCLYNLYRLFQSGLHNESPLLQDKTGLIESQEGCFRLGYSESTQTFFLFFAFHPEDLAMDREGVDGPLSFRHKDRLFLVKAYKALGDAWIKDGKHQLDASWVPGEIHTFLSKFRHILFHEAVLHQLTPTASASIHVGYNVTPVHTQGQNKVRVEITNKEHHKHLLTHMPDRLFGGEDTQKTTRGLYERAKKMLQPDPPLLLLTLLDCIEGDGIDHVTDFNAKGLSGLIAHDFSARLETLKKGLPPVPFKDSPRLWAYCTGAAVCDKLVHFTHELRDDLPTAAREAGLAAARVFLHTSHESLIDQVVENVFHLGQHENLKIIATEAAREWRHLIAHHERILVPALVRLRAEIHECGAPIDVEKMGDIRPIDPQRHTVALGLDNGNGPAKQDDARTFLLWLRRRFLMPHNSTLRYLDAEGRCFDPRRKDPAELDTQIKVVRLKGANGLVMHYVRETQRLYTYYSKPDYEGPARLPLDAATYFAANKMIVIDMSPAADPARATAPAGVTTLPFAQGVHEIRAASQIAHFAPAEKPLQTTRPAPKAAKGRTPDQCWTCEMP